MYVTVLQWFIVLLWFQNELSTSIQPLCFQITWGCLYNSNWELCTWDKKILRFLTLYKCRLFANLHHSLKSITIYARVNSVSHQIVKSTFISLFYYLNYMILITKKWITLFLQLQNIQKDDFKLPQLLSLKKCFVPLNGKTVKTEIIHERQLQSHS